MVQIRRGLFETNSSSTHSICITKDRELELFYPEKLYIRCQHFGWEGAKLETPEDKASYLYSAILTLYNREDVEIAKNQIFTFLSEVGVDCEFEPAMYPTSHWCKGYFYCYNAWIDHASENDLPLFIKNTLTNRGRFLRFLFSRESFVLTGNDNQATNINIDVTYPHESYYKGN